MRVLTVRQPWAWAIIHGGKDVENRVRNIAGSYRGPVAIHAGLAPFEQHNSASRAHKAVHGTETTTELVFGAIIGAVDLVGVHLDEGPGSWDAHDAVCCESEWAEGGVWHLEFANPRRLLAPISYKGALGLRTLPDEIVAKILREAV